MNPAVPQYHLGMGRIAAKYLLADYQTHALPKTLVAQKAKKELEKENALSCVLRYARKLPDMETIFELALLGEKTTSTLVRHLAPIIPKHPWTKTAVDLINAQALTTYDDGTAAFISPDRRNLPFLGLVALATCIDRVERGSNKNQNYINNHTTIGVMLTSALAQWFVYATTLREAAIHNGFVTGDKTAIPLIVTDSTQPRRIRCKPIFTLVQDNTDRTAPSTHQDHPQPHPQGRVFRRSGWTPRGPEGQK